MTIKEIRKAVESDLDRIMSIFEHARTFMAENGNPTQWNSSYPGRDLIIKEIESGHCYVCTNEKNSIVATFCFVKGPDPTYSYIFDGSWISDDDYYVIHRLASDGSVRNTAGSCIEWCGRHSSSLRADTHENNRIMQHILQKNGFVRCGKIYVANGTERIAYQKL